MGVIAQDIQKILPDLVRYNKSVDFLSVDYTSLIGLIIAGFQDQQKIIEKYETDIEYLKNTVAELVKNRKLNQYIVEIYFGLINKCY